jgi:hypothetical protein
MGFFTRLFGGKAIPDDRKVEPSSVNQAEPSEKDSFQSPILLAEWVNRWWLQQIPLEDNYASLPGEEQRKSYNITYEQRERYVREITVLRLAGVSLFIRVFRKSCG